MLMILKAALTALCALFVAIPAYAVELILGPAATPWEECRQAIYDDDELARKAYFSEEDYIFREDLLALCDLNDPLNENWWRLQVVIMNAERTDDADTYLGKLGVTTETLESRIEEIRIFSARQEYARFYMWMHWQLRSKSFPSELSDLYLAYGALLDPSFHKGRERYSRVYDRNLDNWAYLRADMLLGFSPGANIGWGLSCAGWEGYIGYSTYNIIPLCRINEWPPPVYPLAERE
jgi:hypothetical protein